MRRAHPITRPVEGTPVQWTPKRLADLGHDERYLETVLAQSPELLGLESLRFGIAGPFAVARQAEIRSAQGRLIYPDIILLSQSGHVIVVEVKLGNNQELARRDVIAQVIDYATSLARFSASDLAALFSKNERDLAKVVSRLFPKCPDAEELASTLAARCEDGDIVVVVACDHAPASTTHLVDAMRVQSSVGFELKLVEVTPYVAEGRPEILFVPNDRLQTETASITRLLVRYEGPRPTVEVVTPDGGDVVDTAGANGGAKHGKWSEQTFFDEARRRLPPEGIAAIRRLYDFAAARASSITWGKGQQLGSFNPRFSNLSDRSLFTIRTDGEMTLNYQWLNDDEETVALRDELAKTIETKLGIEARLDGFPTMKLKEWMLKADGLIECFTQTLDRAAEAEGELR